jgi:hypothetical protein
MERKTERVWKRRKERWICGREMKNYKGKPHYLLLFVENK